VATNQDAVLLAYDSATGAQEWPAALWDGPTHLREDTADLAVVPDGSQIALTGRTGGAAGKFDVFTVAFSATDGSKDWDNVYDGPTHGDESSSTITATPDGLSYVLTGFTNNDGGNDAAGHDILTMGLDGSNGSQEWAKQYDGPAQAQDDGSFVALSPNGNVAYVAGDSTAKHGLDFIEIAYRIGAP